MPVGQDDVGSRVGDLAAVGQGTSQLGGHDEMSAVADSLAHADLDRGLLAIADDHSLVKPQLIDPAHHQARIAVDCPFGQPFHR